MNITVAEYAKRLSNTSVECIACHEVSHGCDVLKMAKQLHVGMTQGCLACGEPLNFSVIPAIVAILRDIGADKREIWSACAAVVHATELSRYLRRDAVIDQAIAATEGTP